MMGDSGDAARVSALVAMPSLAVYFTCGVCNNLDRTLSRRLFSLTLGASLKHAMKTASAPYFRRVYLFPSWTSAIYQRREPELGSPLPVSS